MKYQVNSPFPFVSGTYNMTNTNPIQEMPEKNKIMSLIFFSHEYKSFPYKQTARMHRRGQIVAGIISFENCEFKECFTSLDL